MYRICFESSGKLCQDEKTIDWIENAIGLPENSDTELIKILLDKSPSFDVDNFDKEVAISVQIVPTISE